MIKLGEVQELYVVKEKDFGVYLSAQEGVSDDSILLPKKQVPEGTHMGDAITCFVYKDSEDRPIATTHTPQLTLGDIAPLTVKEITAIGAFLDWGLEKDLFLPFHEQLGTIKEGKSYLVSLYVDKSSRLCATMKIGQRLSMDHEYTKNEWVEGTVYNINPDHGVFVAVDQKYLGRIPKQEVIEKVSIGDTLKLRVASIAPDGKLTLSPNEPAYKQMDADAKVVMDAIDSYDGCLPFTDKANPEVIKREMGMSKNAFKRAVGRLLKDKLIIITDNAIRRS